MHRRVARKGEMKMKAKRIEAYKCPHCDEMWEDEQEAIDCCTIIETVEAWKCSECDQLYEDKEDAKECCK